MKAWWDELQSRDRMIVIAVAALVAISLIYVLALKPLSDNRATLRNNIAGKQATLIWMQESTAEIQQLRRKSGGARTTSGRSLLSVVEASAKRAGLRKPIQRMTPDGEDALKVWVDKAEFDKLIRWLGDLQSKQGVGVSRATFNRAGANGLVNVRLTLSRT